jgi:hypothetical protein
MVDSSPESLAQALVASPGGKAAREARIVVGVAHKQSPSHQANGVGEGSATDSRVPSSVCYVAKAVRVPDCQRLTRFKTHYLPFIGVGDVTRLLCKAAILEAQPIHACSHRVERAHLAQRLRELIQPIRHVIPPQTYLKIRHPLPAGIHSPPCYRAPILPACYFWRQRCGEEDLSTHAPFRRQRNLLLLGCDSCVVGVGGGDVGLVDLRLVRYWLLAARLVGCVRVACVMCLCGNLELFKAGSGNARPCDALQ